MKKPGDFIISMIGENANIIRLLCVMLFHMYLPWNVVNGEVGLFLRVLEKSGVWCGVGRGAGRQVDDVFGDVCVKAR